MTFFWTGLLFRNCSHGRRDGRKVQGHLPPEERHGGTGDDISWRSHPEFDGWPYDGPLRQHGLPSDDDV